MPTAPTINHNNNNIQVNILGFGNEDLSHVTSERLRQIYESTPVKDILCRVIELLYFDGGSRGRNSTFIMPPPGTPGNQYAVIREPTDPRRIIFAPADDVARHVATKGVDVIDESINIDDSSIYCELESELHGRIDDHVTKLADILENEPTSEKGREITYKVSAALSDITRIAVSLTC
ncbi:hypothetical protein HYH03_003657 [Edaphochlamys debaryana]|uniref:Uncharacterized protein n=1 Tax=Edaphochlamys debaryana TaxID=47281 RepID=A0A835YBU9_9CHLO|nr:hypothetical protein HYH03_003657 [Edaphochlamys debaryana]|eukprot:KAG2498398.1 hypothetical protein HYH03_003657 [Edaphochlamys debaryana]